MSGYADDAGHIQRVNDGYVLRIFGNAGTTTLLIRNDGSMLDVSGAAILRSDIVVAGRYLPQIGAGDLATRLYDGGYQGEAASAVVRHMLGS